MEQTIKKVSEWIEPELEKVFEPQEKEDITVKAAMYSLMAGGKRLRPLMMHMTADLFSMEGQLMDDVRYFAATLEMVHTYSLIHDDLPAMDNDDLRRGKPTCHKVYGEGIAVLAGDLLLNKAYERLFEICKKKSTYTYAAAEFAKNAGLSGMIGGQSIDIDSVSREISLDMLYRLQDLKTGALIRIAVTTPFNLMFDTEEKRSQKQTEFNLLNKLAGHIGLAFQIKDDILDVTSDEQTLGKSTGKDMRDSKPTFVTMLGFDEAQNKLKEEIDGCRQCLAELESLGYNTQEYSALVVYLENREK